MIATVTGVIAERHGETLVVQTDGGVGYAVTVPVVASGGVGSLQHLVDGVIEGRADAVLAASIFHFGEHTINDAKAALEAAGVVVRPTHRNNTTLESIHQ